MKQMTREEIDDFCGLAAPNESIIVPDGLDGAFIGIATEEEPPQAVYSIERCIQILTKDMSQEEAEEYFWFNVAGSQGEGFPLYISTPEEIY
tara:strand:+ start:1543 stop:1818 length:276 start_codon:yes stop_codon:yes gene_type:complete